MLPTPSIELPASNPHLLQMIAETIERSPQQRITFAEFMELALYQPEYGYYATNHQGAGIQQDFFTSAHLSADFGELLAIQFVQFWQILNYPRPFTLVEMGAGQGLLAQDILHYLHRHHFECFAAIDYVIVETSPALVATQQQRLGRFSEQKFPEQKFPEYTGQLTWKTWDEISLKSIVGCCFSNELVDAFPVHLVEINHGQIEEVYVGLDRLGSLTEIRAVPSTPELVAYFDWIGVRPVTAGYPQPYRTEINLAALDWIKTVSQRLQRGYMVTIDYGYPAERYYSPARSQGTLQCYYQHRHHSDPYRAIGYQDITAHVDFTALRQQGEQCGLHTLGSTAQAMFLMALGLGDRIAALSAPHADLPLQTILQRRQMLHSLMDPMGLGNFNVLIQSRGLTAAEQQQSLQGLTMPAIG